MVAGNSALEVGRIDRPSLLTLMRQELYAIGDYSLAMRAYVAAHRLDLDAIYAHTGLLAVVLAQLTGAGRWDFDPDGTPTAVIEVLAADGATVVDLVAWPLDAPDRFAVAVGEADMLGSNAATNPATFCSGKPLRVHRTPLAWLKAGCGGCVVLNSRWGGHWLSKALQLAPAGAALLAEDLAHGREIISRLPKAFDRRRLLVPVDHADHRGAA